jgi:peptidyl-tRNA hydrolase
MNLIICIKEHWKTVTNGRSSEIANINLKSKNGQNKVVVNFGRTKKLINNKKRASTENLVDISRLIY